MFFLKVDKVTPFFTHSYYICHVFITFFNKKSDKTIISNYFGTNSDLIISSGAF